MRFRVWCLSWDDTDENGRDVVKYDPVTGQPPARKGEIGCTFLSDAGAAAEVYADWCHDNRDGYECTWPLTFRVRGEDGTERDFKVERDYDPTFTARPMERKP